MHLEQKHYTTLAWSGGIVCILYALGFINNYGFFSACLALLAAAIAIPKTYWGSSLSKLKLSRNMRAVSAFTLLLIAISIAPSQPASNSVLSTVSSTGGNVSVVSNVSQYSVCPDQGWFESDWDYCVTLCMVNKTDSGSHQDTCAQFCDISEYNGGSNALAKKIADYLCKKCNKCTPEQLAKIEENKRNEAAGKLYNECNDRCFNETIKVRACNCTNENQPMYCTTNDRCNTFRANCTTSCVNGTFIPYEGTVTKIEDDQAQRIEEQKQNELQTAIENQSKSNGGFIFLINTSDESRELTDGGVTYSFPYPTTEPVKVPVELGKKLISSGTFKLAQ